MSVRPDPAPSGPPPAPAPGHAPEQPGHRSGPGIRPLLCPGCGLTLTGRRRIYHPALDWRPHCTRCAPVETVLAALTPLPRKAAR